MANLNKRRSGLNKWRSISALANAHDAADDVELASRYVAVGLSFRMFDKINGRAIVGLSGGAPVYADALDASHVARFAEEARTMRKELLELLSSLAVRGSKLVAVRSRESEARRIVEKYAGHSPATKRIVAVTKAKGIKGEGLNSFFDTFLKLGWLKSDKRVFIETPEAGAQIVPRAEFGPPKTRLSLKFASPFEAICFLAKGDVLDKARGLGPLLRCDTCNRFFVNGGFFERSGGRGRYCSVKCKPLQADKDYMAQWKVKRLREEGPEAVRAAMEKLKRRKMPEARKRELLAIYTAVLSRRLG